MNKNMAKIGRMTFCSLVVIILLGFLFLKSTFIRSLENQPSYGSKDLTNSRYITPFNCSTSTGQPLFSVLSWNIEGLNPDKLAERTEVIVSYIRSVLPHVVCLQEVVRETLSTFKSSLSDIYQVFGAPDYPGSKCRRYFVAVLIRKHSAIQVDTRSFLVYPFPSSRMGRHLLSIDLILHPSRLVEKPREIHARQSPDKLRLRIYTSHLESLDIGKTERVKQLQYAWNRMSEITPLNPNSTSVTSLPNAAILCGDLNLEDNEVKQVGGVPKSIVDVWEATGSSANLHDTWDPKRNRNARLLSSDSASFRYDRMYQSGRCLKPMGFALCGFQAAPNTELHPSDHWGILGLFSAAKSG
ncbi:unnamed protein product [Calicophoron daubneyi]|uniref:Endonuclease/exonuclease/phosphatase domain-containing protein n=1 Tax=Calicophoron daubneyi TaxID=300641 RepID=A0AAV2TNB3_CALDB